MNRYVHLVSVTKAVKWKYMNRERERDRNT